MPWQVKMTDNKADIHAAIQERLREDGFLDEITACIRSRILRALLHENRSILSSAPSHHDLNHQSVALLWLLYHFLEHHGYTHTLSVFAAESRLEHSPPWSCSDALSDIGLLGIWDEVRKSNLVQTDDFISAIQAVVLWVNSLQEKTVASDVQSAENMNISQVETSIQTDVINIDEETDNGHRGGTYNEFVVVEIERECQRRMRQEMNEKLRLSAKKQAILATRRLEQKHKEALQALHHQIEAERTHAMRREKELTKELTRQQFLAHQEQDLSEQRIQALTLEMQSQQREVEVMQKLRDDERNLQMQVHEVAMQRDESLSKDLLVESLTQEKSNLLAEMQDLRQCQTAALALQQSSFDHKQSDIESQMEALREKYIAAKGDLDLSRNEVTALLALLKQSQAAIEAVSFRDIGPIPVISQQALFSKSSTRPSLLLAPRAQSNTATNFRRTIHPSSSATYKAGNVSCLRELKGKHLTPNPPKDESTSQDAILDRLPRTQIDHAVNTHNSNAPTVERISNIGRSRIQIMDPPCASSKDPPEMNETTLNDEKNNEADDLKHNFRGSLIGNEIVLNISSITDDLRWQDGRISQGAMSAETMIPEMMQSTHTESEKAVAEDTADETNNLQQSTTGGALLIKSSVPIERNEELVAESEQFKCLLEPHHHICSTKKSTVAPTPLSNNSQRSTSGIAVSDAISEQLCTADEDINTPSTIVDRSDNVSPYCNEVESKNHGYPLEPIQQTNDSFETNTITNPQRSTSSFADSESQYSKTDDHQEEAGENHNSLGPIQSIYHVDEAHATEIASNAQRSTVSIADSTQCSEYFYTLEGNHHPSKPGSVHASQNEAHLTSTANEPQRHKEANDEPKSHSEQSRDKAMFSKHPSHEEAGEYHSPSQSIHYSDPDKALAAANYPERSTTSLADSEQYSEHFDSLDEGNYLPSEPDFTSHKAKAASPPSPSVSSENYSDEFSSISER